MNRKYKILLLTLILPCIVFSQNMKPRIMIIPADIYMNKNNFKDKDRNNDYFKAFNNDHNLRLAISKIEEAFGHEGFIFVNLEEQLKGIQNERITKEFYDGGEMQQTALDELFAATKPDIKIDLDFTLIGSGFDHKLMYNLKAIDTYTYGPIAVSSGTGPSAPSDDIAYLVQIAIKDHMPSFKSQITNYFHRLVAEGRDLAIQIQAVGDVDLEEEDYDYPAFDMEEELLVDIVREYMYKNTKKGMYSMASASESVIKFVQVRVGVIDEKGRKVDAYTFLKGLRKVLRKEPFNFKCKIKPIKGGLGEAWLLLSEKE